jgi:hypothetical protein
MSVDGVTEQGHPPGRPRLDGRRTADPDHVVHVGARQFTGMSADTPAFQAAYAEQLRCVVERLAD